MKTAVADTSISAYRDPALRVHMNAQELLVTMALRFAGPSTLSEIRAAIVRQGGPSIPESTISGRLHDLAERNLVIDDLPKRECRITGRVKKNWRFTGDAKPTQAELFSRN